MTKRLSAQGWTVIEEVRGPMPVPGVGAYSRPLKDGFSAVAIFPSEPEELRPVADEEPPTPQPLSGRPALHAARRVDASGLVVVGRLGVSYEPADALIHACTGSRAAGIVLNAPFVSVAASGASSLHDAEDQLARFAEDDAISVARRYADIDRLVETLREGVAVPFTGGASSWYMSLGIDPDSTLGPLQSAEAELIPALLALAGRRDEARQALAQYASGDIEGIENRDYRRFARQLTRWLDANGELLRPRTPPRWPPPSSFKRAPRPPVSFAEFFFDSDRKEKVRSDNRARKEAVDAVRAAGHDKSREEIRALLERELSERDLTTEPLLVERQVEMILADREPFGKTRFAIRALKQLKDSQASRGQGGLLKQVGGQGKPQEEPDWLKPPARAAYPVWSPGPQWTVVELDPASRQWLTRIAESDPARLTGGRWLEVWLTWTNGHADTDPRLAVHIGTEQVGKLEADVEQYFRPVMEAAAERDEDPWTRGRLSAISGPMSYLLEVELPASPPGDDNADNR
jgi:hypothetical protein